MTAIETSAPALSAVRGLVDRFHCMVRGRTPDALPGPTAQAQATMPAPSGRGIAAGRCAVEPASTEPWSDAATEGFVTRLEPIRRQMHGRGKLDLLRAPVVPA